MFEHVGGKNYRTYFETVKRCLKPGGLSLLHTIGSNGAPAQTDPWIEKYIFPNSMIPAASQVTAALEGLFVVEDWHNFGTDYDRTLIAWQRQLRPRLAAARGQLRRALPPHVAFLPGRLRRRVPQPSRSAVATRY